MLQCDAQKAMERCHDATMSKNEMSTERCFLASHRPITPSLHHRHRVCLNTQWSFSAIHRLQPVGVHAAVGVPARAGLAERSRRQRRVATAAAGADGKLHHERVGRQAAGARVTLPRARAPPEPAAEEANELGAEVAAAEAIDEEVDGRVDRHQQVADASGVATRAGQPQVTDDVQRPEEMTGEGRRVAHDADQHDGDDDHRHALLRRRHRVVGAARLARQSPEAVRSSQLAQQLRVERREERHRDEVHEDREGGDAVGEQVDDVALHQAGRPHPAVLEEARQREEERHDDHDRHVAVGAHQRADPLRLQRLADGDVAVDGEQDRQPGVDEPDEVHEHVGVRPHVFVRRHVRRVHVALAAQRIGYVDAAKEVRQQNEGIGDGEALQ